MSRPMYNSSDNAVFSGRATHPSTCVCVCVCVCFFAASRVVKAPPVKLSSLTYLSFNLERLVMHSTADLQSPFITVSVHDSRGRRVSLTGLCCCPADGGTKLSILFGIRPPLAERVEAVVDEGHSSTRLGCFLGHGYVYRSRFTRIRVFCFLAHAHYNSARLHAHFLLQHRVGFTSCS